MFAAFPSPIILPAVEWFFVTLINQPSTFASAVRMMFESSWPAFLAVTVLATVLAAAAWRRSRAFGLPRSQQVVWTIFVFLFGVLGYVGYRLHRRWPTRAQCPHCHAHAPRDRDACSRCKTAFSPAPLKGIEVFA